jgi:hypothetical protein
LLPRLSVLPITAGGPRKTVLAVAPWVSGVALGSRLSVLPITAGGPRKTVLAVAPGVSGVALGSRLSVLPITAGGPRKTVLAVAPWVSGVALGSRLSGFSLRSYYDFNGAQSLVEPRQLSFDGNDFTGKELSILDRELNSTGIVK